MKKAMCILLSAAMMTSMTACALAKSPESIPQAVTAPIAIGMSAETFSNKTVDQRLAELAVKVKSTLGIGDDYEEFSGNLRENALSPKWNLNWNRESDSISVEAFENGLISSYYYYENDETYRNARNFPPSFPSHSREQAQKAAQSFLQKVLGDGETVKFSEQSSGQMNTEMHRFSGTILVNGLESPLSFSISVRARDGKITSFYRDCMDDSYIGGIPSPTPNTNSSEAGSLLKETLSLRTEYVLEDNKAVLRYLPESSDEFYVDAQTGKLVNLTELYKLVTQGDKNTMNDTSGLNGAIPEASTDSGAAAGLTKAELEGISKLEGVLTKEDLDKKVRNITQLGLEKYTLASANYSLDRETDEVIAYLSYTRRDGDDIWRRSVTCDAKTGILQNVWSSIPHVKDRNACISGDKGREITEEFLKEYWAEDFAKTELYESDPWERDDWDAAHSFTYAQKENGFFFPENSIDVLIDIEDGSISGFSRNWTKVTDFENPEGIMSESEALDAWFNHYNLRFGYNRVPVKLDPDMADAAPLMEKGYSYFYSMKLAYVLKENEGEWATGMNAKTGEIIIENRYEEEAPILYSDLNGYAGREKLETLAGYGIGWAGGKCEPDKNLTQLDFVALLVSTDGDLYNPAEDDVDELYRYAYALGILSAGERKDDKVLTRGDVVKTLLDCAGYGDIAKLPGIFSCSYPDAAQIPTELLGYAAIAQGMGITGAKQEFAAGQNVTRGEAAEMLYNFMDR